jgi:hypothetical protein
MYLKIIVFCDAAMWCLVDINAFEMLTASNIGAIMETLSTSETSVSLHLNTHRSNIEDHHLCTCRCENLKSHRKHASV